MNFSKLIAAGGAVLVFLPLFCAQEWGSSDFAGSLRKHRAAGVATNRQMMNISSRENAPTQMVPPPPIPSDFDFTQLQVISMGLPKTGTTATANSLQNLGLKVAHNQGDILEKGFCNVMINAMEKDYDVLYNKHSPDARWVVTYSLNVSQWVDSIIAHVENPDNRVDYLDKATCRLWGCDKGGRSQTLSLLDSSKPYHDNDPDPPLNQTALLELQQLYHNYYQGLFAFLKSKKQPYALVDVRANDYRYLSYVHPNWTAPFPPKNTRENRGQWPKCRKWEYAKQKQAENKPKNSDDESSG